MNITNSKDIFLVEKFLLRPFGVWPCENFKPRRICLCTVFIVLCVFLPQLNTLIQCLNSGDYTNGTATVPRVLSTFIFIFSPLIVKFHQEKFEILVNSIESFWYKYSVDEFPKWNAQRSRVVNISSKLLIFTLTAVHMVSLCLSYVPTVYKTVAFMLSDIDITDSSIDRDTFWKVK